MIALLFLSVFLLTSLALLIVRCFNPSSKQKTNIIKVSDRCWIVGNKMIDLDAEEKREEEVKRMDKLMFDFEVGVAEREFQKREELAKLTGSINMIARRRVIMFNGKILR